MAQKRNTKQTMAFVNFDRRFLNDRFCDMSKDAQLLYFYINFNSQKGGIFNNLYGVARAYNIKDKACKELFERGYIEDLSELYDTKYKIVDWNRNNDLSLSLQTRSDYEYQQWKKKVKERDKCCQKCGSTKNLVAHHIKSYKYYPELRTNLSNGITLCDKCHKEEHKKGKYKNGK